MVSLTRNRGGPVSIGSGFRPYWSPMSAAALELVRIATQAYAAGDPEISLQLADPNIGWDERASRHDGEIVVGQRDVLLAMHRYFDGFEEYSFKVEKLASASDSAVVGVCSEHGTTVDGLPVDRRYGALWTVRDGKIVSWTTFLSPREALRAAREVEDHGRALAETQAETAEPAGDVFTPEQRRASKRRARLKRFARGNEGS
jgi:ketosteroid isomerase-like protein